MKEKNELLFNELNEENLESMIYEIRGERVMLDFDLARIYGYETKRFNEQVKNNIEKFPEDFMFQLSSNEVDFLVDLKPIFHKNSPNQPEEISRSIFSTAIQRKGIKGGRTTFPYAFTEKGMEYRYYDAFLSLDSENIFSMQLNIRIDHMGATLYDINKIKNQVGLSGSASRGLSDFIAIIT